MFLKKLDLSRVGLGKAGRSNSLQLQRERISCRVQGQARITWQPCFHCTVACHSFKPPQLTLGLNLFLDQFLTSLATPLSTPRLCLLRSLRFLSVSESTHTSTCFSGPPPLQGLAEAFSLTRQTFLSRTFPTSFFFQAEACWQQTHPIP